MEFVIYLIIMIVMLIISDLTRPVPKSPRRPGLGDFQFPTADASRKIPVVWGEPLIRGPNVTWYGDLFIRKITKKVKGVFSDKKYTAGYMYFIGMHLAVCVSNGDARLLKILAGPDVIWTGNVGAGRYTINQWDIWGGDESEGGVQGDFDWCPGGLAQGQNSYLASVLGPLVPAYRSTARLVWRRGYLGTSKYIKEWAMQVRRLPVALGSPYSDINGEANPAEILYEILVNSHWGLGVSNLDIDVASFQAAAQTLYEEGFGLSLYWDGAKQLREMADVVQAHIDSIMFVNVLTGKWTLHLNRKPTADQLLNLPVFDQDSIQELESFSRPSLDETVNEVNVIWTENGDTSLWPAKAQDLGLYHVHDKQFVSVDNSYPGITNYPLAQRCATRDLYTLSYPLVKTSFKTGRQAWAMRPGSRFKFSWEPLGAVELVMVVIGIDYGTLDDNQISIEAVQDVFSLGAGLYTGSGQSGWIPPSRNPLPPVNMRMEFLPYWLMLVDDGFQSPITATPLLMVEPPSGTHLSYEVQYTDPSLNNAWNTSPDSQPFTPTAVLAHDYLETSGTDGSGTLILRDMRGAAAVGSNSTSEIQTLGAGLLVIGSEWMAVSSAVLRSDGSVQITEVHRGLLDSVIQRHLAGTKAWFISDGAGRTPTQLLPFEAGTYRAKIIPRAIGGLLNIEQAPTISISTNATSQNARPLYPYPPRDLVLNGSRTPLVVPNGSLTATWKDRNRAAETTIFFHSSTTTVTREAGVVYRARLFNDQGTLLAQSPDLAAGTNTYTFNLAGNLPAAGYVTVQAFNPTLGGGSPAATIWFGLQVDYTASIDEAPQRFLDDAEPWSFWRLAD